MAPCSRISRFQDDLGNGFESLEGGANEFYLNEGYLTWAGITAGKAESFYSFTGGGLYWPNFFSPDQKGFNQPILMAYTASFGGGFSATLAAQSPGSNRRLGRRDGYRRPQPHLRRPALARRRRPIALQVWLGRGAGFGSVA